jgi:hypothetical protein
MNTAVPGTRRGLDASTAWKKSASGVARAARRVPRILRPVFHVVINVNSSAAIASGSHPPCAILSTFAPKKARSIERNTPVTSRASGNGQRHRSVKMTWRSNAVITMVNVTAIPYAAARPADEPKPMTMASVPAINAQLTWGT